MSYALAKKIKQLRDEHSISQEKMAEVLGTTRQRYARMESGQIDLSYVTIKKIADFFGVPDKEILNALNEKKELTALFREKQDNKEALKAIASIEQILKVFNSHEKLYFNMKERGSNED